jgi:hypothetical protein
MTRLETQPLWMRPVRAGFNSFDAALCVVGVMWLVCFVDISALFELELAGMHAAAATIPHRILSSFLQSTPSISNTDFLFRYLGNSLTCDSPMERQLPSHGLAQPPCWFFHYRLLFVVPVALSPPCRPSGPLRLAHDPPPTHRLKASL